jgi:hypothetical protein
VRSAADRRVNRPRVARPGDVCVLLEPAEDEIADVRQRQAALQARFEGCPHERVHLTCQRFELRDEHPLPDLVQLLRSGLGAMRPFPIVAVSLIQYESPFWRSHLLRWRIRPSDDLRRLGRIVERALGAAGIRPHFSSASGWEPTLLTALEGIPEVDLERYRDDILFPHHLFTARWVVLSRIKGYRQFEILGTIRLQLPSEPVLCTSST